MFSLILRFHAIITRPAFPGFRLTPEGLKNRDLIYLGIRRTYAMTTDKDELQALRREIDVIDDSIHDLII